MSEFRNLAVEQARRLGGKVEFIQGLGHRDIVYFISPDQKKELMVAEPYPSDNWWQVWRILGRMTCETRQQTTNSHRQAT